MTIKTSTKHDPECRLCQILAAGGTHTKIGREIPALCGRCHTHHPAGGCAATDKAICPSCRKNRRVLVSEPSVGRSERKRYGVACESCLLDKGWQKFELGALAWWEAKPVEDDVDDATLFESLNATNIWTDKVHS